MNKKRHNLRYGRCENHNDRKEPDYIKKSKLTKWAEQATIIAFFVSIVAVVIAMRSFNIARQSLEVAKDSLDVMRNPVVEALENINNNTKGLNSGIQPIQMTVGIGNGEDAFLDRVEVPLGETRPVQISFKNISGFRMDTIKASVILPPELKFVSGSTRVYSRVNPNGWEKEDGIIDGFIELGDYSYFEDSGYNSGSVSFRVTVSADKALIESEAEPLEIRAYIVGFINNEIATDKFEAKAIIEAILDVN